MLLMFKNYENCFILALNSLPWQPPRVPLGSAVTWRAQNMKKMLMKMSKNVKNIKCIKLNMK